MASAPTFGGLRRSIPSTRDSRSGMADAPAGSVGVAALRPGPVHDDGRSSHRPLRRGRDFTSITRRRSHSDAPARRRPKTIDFTTSLTIRWGRPPAPRSAGNRPAKHRLATQHYLSDRVHIHPLRRAMTKEMFRHVFPSAEGTGDRSPAHAERKTHEHGKQKCSRS